MMESDGMEIGRISKYSKIAIALHWAIAIFIVSNVVLAKLAEGLPRQAAAVYMTPHKEIGITILVLSVLRLLWRMGHKPPEQPGALRSWEKKLSKSVHYIFYFLIIAVPLSGWLMVSAYPGAPPLSYFGLFTLDLPVGESKALAGIGHEAHEILGKVLVVLIILHVLGALKHQFADRIPFIQRMWP